MARKKQEIALQTELETQEEWEEALTKEGLLVIDVYQEWAGPCKSMIGNFRRMRNELSDNLLKFAMVYQEWAGKSTALLNVLKNCLVKVEHDKMLKLYGTGADAIHLYAAKADTIDSLERYRGKCEPCYLFYAGGVLVAVVRGANAPILQKTVVNELKQEHAVLDGSTERVEIKDPKFAHLDSDKSGDEESETEKGDEAAQAAQITPKPSVEMVSKEVTVALLKPDIVKDGKADEVLAKMEASGIEILKHEERQLTEDEAKEFYGHLKDEPFFDELVQFMCSGPSHVLLLSKPDTGKGIIDDWKELIGPTSVEEAKEKAPDSLRAQYGTKEMFNALHGSDSQQNAAKELAFFFPEYQVPQVAKPGSRAHPSRVAQRGVQRTLALIRPDALTDKKDDILKKIEESGFKIALQKEIQLNKEQAESFYKEHADQPYYQELIEKMTSGPVLALGLARDDAISEWRKLLGPNTVTEAKEQAPQSLRAQYSVDGTDVNMLHGSDSPQKASEELNFFFPMQQTVAVIKPDAYENKDAIIEKIKEAGFHVAARKETTLTKDIAMMLYKQNADQDYHNDLIDHMTSGPTLFMVLSKEDAVENWRGVIGPTDPTQAKEQAPSSIRAQFGVDIKANAVHGPSTEDNAKQVIQEVFGDLQTKTDGSVDAEQGGDKSEMKEGVNVSKQETVAESSEAPAAAEEQPAAAQGESAPEAAAESPAAAESAEEKSADGTVPATEQAADAESSPPASEEQQPAGEEQPPASEEKPATPAAEQPAAEPATEQAAESSEAPPTEEAPAANEGEAAAEADKPAEEGEAEKPAGENQSDYSEEFSEGEEEEEPAADQSGTDAAADEQKPAEEEKPAEEGGDSQTKAESEDKPPAE